MRFAFTDDQLALRDAVRDLVVKECQPDVVRAAWPVPDADGQGSGAGARTDPNRVGALWQHLAEMGVAGVAVGEADGGLGMGALEWVLVAEELGFVAAPVPFLDTAVVAAPLLASSGDPGGNLPAVLAGESTVVAELTGTGPVIGAATADLALLRVGDDLRVLEAGALASVGEAVETVDGARPALLVDRVALRGMGQRLDVSPDAVAASFDAGVVAASAQLVGLARRMLDLSVGYVTERKQFGVPIGSFQAVKHHLADARLQIEFAAPAVHRAAWSLANASEGAGAHASMAKSLASDAAHLVGRKALQVHGGIGYTVEYDLHLFLKRAWSLEREWGTAVWHRDRLGRSLGV